MSRASECREWLREHPGWHTSTDVLNALGKKGVDRGNYNRAMQTMADQEMLGRRGQRRVIRYCYLAGPKRPARGGWLSRAATQELSRIAT